MTIRSNYLSIIFLIATVSLLYGCEEMIRDNEKSIGNKPLTVWFNSKLYPRIESLKSVTPVKFSSIKDNFGTGFLGAKITYDKHGGLKAYNDKYLLDKTFMDYRFLKDESLNSYMSYIKNRGGKVDVYKYKMSEELIKSVGNIIDDDYLSSCRYNNLYIGKISGNVDSAYIDVTCVYNNPHALFRGQTSAEITGRIGIVGQYLVDRFINDTSNADMQNSYLRTM